MSTNSFESLPGLHFREVATNALRYWEPRRLIYNAVLAVVVIGYFLAALPGSMSLVSFNGLLTLFFFLVLANVCYCAAYVVDGFVPFSGLRSLWLRGRWVLFLIGTLFAAIITRFVILGALSSAG